MTGLLQRPRLLLILCALFWAGNFVLGRALHDAVPPVAFAFWRWLAASLLVLPFVSRALRRQWPLLRSSLGRLLLLALLGVTLFNTLVYVGLQTTTATNSVLIQSTMPVQILLLNRVMFGVPATLQEWAGIGLSLCGVLLVAGNGDVMTLVQGEWPVGNLWVLCAAFTWALYSVLLRWRPQDLAPAAFLGFTLLAGTLMLLPLYLLERAGGAVVQWDLPNLLGVAYVAVFPSALAYLFWNRGVAMIGANAAGHFIHLMPVFGILLAAMLLGEVPQPYHLFGAALVASGIFLTWRHIGR